jgi:hypothetical protein
MGCPHSKASRALGHRLRHSRTCLPACLRGMLAQRLATSISRLVAAGLWLVASGLRLAEAGLGSAICIGRGRPPIRNPAISAQNCPVPVVAVVPPRSANSQPWTRNLTCLSACRMARPMHLTVMCPSTPYGPGWAANAALHGFAEPPGGAGSPFIRV